MGKIDMETKLKLIDFDAPDPLKTINRSAAARALGLNVSNISRILSGQRIPHVVTLKRFADYLGLTLDEFYIMLGLDKSDR